MKNYTFEVHTYAPELNKIFVNGIDVTKHYFPIISRLTKEYPANMRLLRSLNTPTFKMWKLTATRIDGSIETRFCAKIDIQGILQNWHEAVRYYASTTILDFRPYFKY